MDNIEKTPFQPYREQEEIDKDKSKVFTVRLNLEEQKLLDVAKRTLRQPKDGTAIKILMEIGSNVLHHQLTGDILQIILKNIEKNKRTGIEMFEQNKPD